MHLDNFIPKKEQGLAGCPILFDRSITGRYEMGTGWCGKIKEEEEC